MGSAGDRVSNQDKIKSLMRPTVFNEGLTAEELDFIVNYEVKYRMGRDAELGDK
jgi:hypothetical protein